MEVPSLSIHNVVMLAESGEVHLLPRKDDLPRVGLDTTSAVRADHVGVVRVAHALSPVSHGDARRSQPRSSGVVRQVRTHESARVIPANHPIRLRRGASTHRRQHTRLPECAGMSLEARGLSRSLEPDARRRQACIDRPIRVTVPSSRKNRAASRVAARINRSLPAAACGGPFDLQPVEPIMTSPPSRVFRVPARRVPAAAAAPRPLPSPLRLLCRCRR